MRIHKKTTNEKELKSFCKSRYYSEENTKWEPFELYNSQEIKEYIENDIQSIKQFFRIKEI